MKSSLFIVVLLMIITSCNMFSGEEIARLSFDRVGNDNENIKTIEVNLKKGDKVHFWTEMDIAYEGDIEMIYIIEVWKDGEKVDSGKLNALDTNPTMMNVKTTVNGSTSWSFTGAMDALPIKEDGRYLFKAIIDARPKSSLTLNKAILILKK